MNINLPRILVIELAIIATGVVLYFAGGLLSEFASPVLIVAFSILLTYALLPAVNWFDRSRLIPRGLAIILTYALLFVATTALIFLISVPLSNQVKQFARDYPKYVEQLQSSIPKYQSELRQRQINYDLQKQIDQFSSKLEDSATVAVSKTGAVITGFFGTISRLFFILFVTAYFLHSGDRFAERIIALFPRRRQRFIKKLAKDYDRILGSFVRGQLLISAIMATAVSVFAAALGIPYWVIIGLVAGVASLIPTIGGYLSLILPIIVGLLTKPILVPIFVVLFIIFNEFTDKLLYPRIVGRAVELHPLLVLLGVLVGVQLAGIAGALLATPTLALLKVTIRSLRNSTGYVRV